MRKWKSQAEGQEGGVAANGGGAGRGIRTEARPNEEMVDVSRLSNFFQQSIRFRVNILIQRGPARYFIADLSRQMRDTSNIVFLKIHPLLPLSPCFSSRGHSGCEFFPINSVCAGQCTRSLRGTIIRDGISDPFATGCKWTRCRVIRFSRKWLPRLGTSVFERLMCSFAGVPPSPCSDKRAVYDLFSRLE